MPLLADAVDTYIEDPTTGMMEFTDKADKIWQNMTAFAARGLGASVLGPYDRAMFALISALEEEPSKTQEILDSRIKAACAWITHASKPLLRWALENAGRTDASPDDTAVYMDGGPLYRGPPLMCLQRWGFWIDRLEELGKDASGAGGGARKVALETARTMRQVEARLGHTL
ncbi:hypothetical protein CSOJ01_00833 [Colletotrichum sojae]|uniref:Uncharacterized protein n=1 Tax=Colletotrichum sojae TaxID=2175907 RepID=A0A8H6N4Z2_9PEZI|nr:hypothetical protein CSOJ01_00833 [Colletotrichum sojae]